MAAVNQYWSLVLPIAIMESASEQNNVFLRIEEQVSAIAFNEGFKNFNLETKAITSNGANFLGDLYLVDVHEDGVDTLKLFLKVSNASKQLRTMVPINEMYRREVFVYTTIVKTFMDLQDKHGVPMKKRYNFPKYYGSNLKEMEELIVLENLTAQGFVLFDRFKSMDWKYSKPVVEELAKFHALSFLLKKENPDLFEELIRNKRSPFKNSPVGMKESINNTLPAVLDIVDPENYSRVKKFINDKANDIFIRTSYLSEPPELSVLMHADYRMSNIMVSYKEQDIFAVKPIDYQTASCGDPITDLLYFLFTGSDEAFRRDHFDDYFEHYHTTLTTQLELFLLDINDIYPRSSFFFDLKNKLIYGLEVGLYMSPVVLVDPAEARTLESLSSEVQEAYKPSEALVRRINGIVRDFIIWGYLNESYVAEDNLDRSDPKKDD